MINLLPQPYRRKLMVIQSFKLALILGIASAAGFIALSIFLVIIQVALANERVAQERQLASFNEESSQEDSILSEINKQNAALSGIEKFKEDRQSVADVLEQLSLNLPEELSLLSFSYTPKSEVRRKEEVIKNPASIAVTGAAPTREQLLVLQDSLREDPFFENVVFPPSNWVSPVDIIFSFQATILP